MTEEKNSYTVQEGYNPTHYSTIGIDRHEAAGNGGYYQPISSGNKVMGMTINGQGHGQYE